MCENVTYLKGLDNGSLVLIVFVGGHKSNPETDCKFFFVSSVSKSLIPKIVSEKKSFGGTFSFLNFLWPTTCKSGR
jgi:hypothetical protein